MFYDESRSIQKNIIIETHCNATLLAQEGSDISPHFFSTQEQIYSKLLNKNVTFQRMFRGSEGEKM